MMGCGTVGESVFNRYFHDGEKHSIIRSRRYVQERIFDSERYSFGPKFSVDSGAMAELVC